LSLKFSADKSQEVKTNVLATIVGHLAHRLWS